MIKDEREAFHTILRKHGYEVTKVLRFFNGTPDVWVLQ